MSYIEELRKSRDKAQVAYQEFALSTRKFSNHLFCFFEGKDNAYYVPRIKQFKDDYYPIKCGGREKVIGVHKLISKHKEYSKYKKAFFIDRDFNASLRKVNPPIFETPCYSIENLYVSEKVFKEILTNELHLSETSDSSFEVCITLFRERQKEFHSSVTLFNSWYSCLIEIRNKEGVSANVSLDDKLPKGFINFTLDSISQNYDLDKIKERFPKAPRVTKKALAEKIKFFKKADSQSIYRGKFELQFVITLIELILQDSSNRQKYIKEKIKFSFGDRLSISQAINVFSGYAETPKTLISYLKKVIK